MQKRKNTKKNVLKIFQREQRSLFGEILDWMLTPLLLLWPLSLALTWLVAQSLANKPFDRALEYNAHALAQQVRIESDGRVGFNQALAAYEVLRTDDADLMYYQISHLDGTWIAGEHDFPSVQRSPSLPPLGQVQLRDDELRGIPIRIAALWIALPLPSGGQVLVQVAETREKRSMLAAEIIKGVMLPQFAILPLAVLLVWLALARGIQPLHRLEERIRARKPEDLSPLNSRAVPQEVLPLVEAVNDLLQRLNESLGTQKRFLADAAHQLKTPLAGLRMQADLALRLDVSAEELKRSLQLIGRSSMRATHTVNQLLALARAEVGSASLQHEPCNLVALMVTVVQEVLPLASAKNTDLGYEGAEEDDPGVWVMGNPTLLQEMMSNLITNAIHYSPSTPERPAVVTARVLPDRFSAHVVLQVEDNGPGIGAQEKELVLQPFYRALGNEADGSGLGLPIVQEIAAQHGGELLILDAHPGKKPPGTCMTVRLATIEAPASEEA